MSFFSLLREYPRLIGFGALFCFGSSVGQTFFISLFVPAVTADLGLAESSLANIYALVTIAGAILLVWAGRPIDRIDLLTYAAAVLVFVAAGSLLLAGSWGLIPLAIGLGMVRMGGQGLMSHVALTGIARHFNARRGAALALVITGFALGEIVLPVPVVWAIGEFGWRTVYAAAGLTAGLVFLPLTIWLLSSSGSFRWPKSEGGGDPVPEVGHERPVGTLTARALWRSPYFLALAPAYCAAPFAVTALIFHQGVIAEGKDLTLGLFAASFALFGLVQIVTGIGSGPMIDRFGARALFPLHLIPFALGTVILALNDGVWTAPVYMGLMGATAGMSGTLRTAVVAELVRPDQLGTARSGLTALMVVSTAFGPAVYGWMMLGGFDTEGLFWTTLVLLAVVSMIAAAAQYAPQRKSA